MRTVSISGFGGSYEWGCQRMLQLGLAWLEQHPNFDFAKAYATYRGIYGVCSAETPTAEELDKAMLDDPTLKEFGVTGAMHQAVVGHLAFIHKNGREKWLEELAAHREPSDFFDFDGTMQSVPSTEFSRKREAERRSELQ